LKAKGDVSIALKRLAEHGQEEQMLKDQQREYEEQREQLKKTRDTLKGLIEEQKKTISDRDKVIGEKERKIYDLKKKTQELEKFKFVLDYKIKELKRDIVPREDEIQDMKKETNKMDSKLKGLNSYNSYLGLVVHDLDTKQTEMQNHIKQQRLLISAQAVKIKRFKDDIYQTVQFIQNYEELKKRVIELKDKYAKEHVKVLEIDPDIHSEYLSQKKYLEKSVGMLKKNLQKDNDIHKQDNLRIMRENVELIKEINRLRKEIDDIKRGGSKGEVSPVNNLRKASQELDGNNEFEGTLTILDKRKRLEKQREEVRALRSKIEQMRLENEAASKTN